MNDDEITIDAWRLAPAILYLVVVGLFLYLVQWQHWNWGYIVGLVLVVIWMAGFVAARGTPSKTWFRW